MPETKPAITTMGTGTVTSLPGPGVAFNSPPPSILPSIRNAIDQAIATLPPGANGALVGVATEKGANVAVVAKIGDGWKVQAWVGKSWGTKDVQGGGAIMKTW